MSAQKLFWLSLFFLGGCINVSLPKATATRASDIEFAAPKSPFVSLGNVKTDQAWNSPGTGNVIAFYTECNSKSDLSLNDLQQESAGAMIDGRVLDQREFDYNGRTALRSIMTGKVESVPMKVEQVFLQKNSCNYILSYTAVEKHFDRERSHFEAFVNAFKVP